MISHLPHFIEDKLIHSCNLNISRKQRSKLALIRNLQFYEVYNKQTINSIDLQHTVLHKIQYKFDSIEPETNGTSTQASDIMASSKTCPNQNNGDIVFGKYIYLNRNDKIVYIIIKCWNYMVVIKRTPEGFCLQAEFEDVMSFQVSKLNKYQTQVSISFLHKGESIDTSFQDGIETLTAAELPTADVYRKMIEKIKKQKSELLVHKTISRKEFSKLKSTQLFGCNILRTPRLDELQILSKCGNSWIKLTANDAVIIGVPIVNNCSSRLTILRNFRAVLLGAGDLTHSFQLYQLNKSFCDIQNIQSFFNDSDSDEKQSSNSSWRQCLDVNLLPETFVVLILKLKIQEFFESSAVNVPLFVFYDVRTHNKTLNQKCFLTTIFFRDIFSNNSCRLLFDEKNLHRDLLTVIASSYETQIRLEYAVSGVAFEDYLCQKLGFYKIPANQNFSEAMNVDGEDDDDNVDFPIKRKIIFFNKNSDSFWHGTLLEISHINETSAYIRIFTKSQEKSKILLKLLRLDLKAICGIKDLHNNVKSLSIKLIELEAALREEFCCCLETYSNSAMKIDRIDINKKQSLHNHLHSKQLKTDLLFKDLLL
ncbi:uncharacterized protein LOC129946583 [Eupeodes corollae]|uniref:uncharacterized protein LOC129946583 n=1 Tax=Eupeodes corollae TaxID=290404 RepID=UPI0024939F4B|nr:uncharacterized protein LOC129946583 [Eupeodes corollae]